MLPKFICETIKCNLWIVQATRLLVLGIACNRIKMGEKKMEITRECVQCLLLPLVILYSVYYFFASIFYDYLSSYFHFYSELPHSPVPRQIICQYRAHQKKNRLKKANATRQIQNENIFGANAFVRYWELLPNTHTYTELHTHTSAPQSAQTFVYITPRLRVK